MRQPPLTIPCRHWCTKAEAVHVLQIETVMEITHERHSGINMDRVLFYLLNKRCREKRSKWDMLFGIQSLPIQMHMLQKGLGRFISCFYEGCQGMKRHQSWCHAGSNLGKKHHTFSILNSCDFGVWDEAHTEGTHVIRWFQTLLSGQHIALLCLSDELRL